MNELDSELKNIVEAAVLVADEPITIKQLIGLFPKDARPDKDEINQAIEELNADCEQRGIELTKVGHGFRFQSKERYASWLRKLYEEKPPRYSRAVLETLSIIAYKQPVTRGDIEDVRGVSVSTDIIRTLLNRQWVKEVGFKDVPGRPALYATTKEFLAYFNLASLRDLPSLEERRELSEIAKDNQIALPIEEINDQQSVEDSEAAADEVDEQEAEAEDITESQPLDQTDGVDHDTESASNATDAPQEESIETQAESESKTLQADSPVTEPVEAATESERVEEVNR